MIDPLKSLESRNRYVRAIEDRGDLKPREIRRLNGERPTDYKVW